MSKTLLPAALLALSTLSAAQDFDRVTWRRVANRYDTNDDGKVTRDELQRRFVFTRLDRNGDGVVTRADFDEQEPSADVPVDDAAGLALFEASVEGILQAKCYECHAESARRVKGGLLVDSLAGMLEGGHSGPALSPGDPDNSMIIEAVRYIDADMAMPPDEKLSDEEIEALERWVELGAPWPGQVVETVHDDLPEESYIDIEAGKEWWSFQPVVKPEVPEVEDGRWPWSPIDHFILERLEEEGLDPVDDAEKGAWLRRVTFDLTGLPPTPEELSAFLADKAKGSYERVVDRLLMSPRYAERWGRHWLDIARYAESSGRESNVAYPHAWRYRDWVIDAFEEDLPYDEFLAFQLAGDLMETRNVTESAERQIATGYLAIGPKSHNQRNPLQFTADLVDEQVDAITQGMLGLTVSCARCHDHKFDPIPTEDYYAMAGILGSTHTMYGTHASPGNTRPTGLIELDEEVRLPNGVRMPSEVRDLYRRFEAGLEREPMRTMEDDRQAAQRERRRAQQAAVVNDILSRWDSAGRPLPENKLAMGAQEGRSRDARVLIRGELDSAGDRIPRGFPQVLVEESPSIDRGSGRRELADWIASAENPLTARVWVNRVWGHLFGRGLVSTPNNFGMSGMAPSHPELLDWLAATFVEEGWSTKALVRQIVLSHTYRLSTEGSNRWQAVDPDVVYLWRMPARRLEAEAIRDSMLYASGELRLSRPVGSPVNLIEGAPRQEELLDRSISENKHRSVYLPVLRDRLAHSLECFDAADPSFVTGDRDETIVATQALYMMNDEDVIATADNLARRLSGDYKTDRERIEQAFLLTLTRKPTSSEMTDVKRFLSDFEKLMERESRSRRSGHAAWSAFLQSLFQSAEFRYRG